MDIESQITQQLQLRALFEQNQNQYKKRADRLLNTLQNLQAQNTQLDLLSNTHLSSLQNYLQDIIVKKQQQPSYIVSSKQNKNNTIQMQIKQKNNSLKIQIQKIAKQIQQITKIKYQYILAQKYTSNQILNTQDIINYYNFELELIYRNKPQNSLLIGFAFDSNQNGTWKIKQSYDKIIQYFLYRVMKNQQIISKLETTIREKVSKSQKIRVNILKLKQMQKEYQERVSNITKYKNLYQYSKQQLKTYLRNTDEEIDKKLAKQIDKNIQQISSRNSDYENAYHCILDVVKKVIDKTEIDKVNQHINKQ